MMNREDILNIFKYVSSVDTKCAEDLTYAVTLTHTCIKKSLDAVKEQIISVTQDNRFDDLQRLSEYCKGLQEIEKQIIDCNMAIRIINNPNEDLASYETVVSPSDTSYITRARVSGEYSGIDHTLYNVDNTEKHTLNEDFVFSKVCCFDFLGKRYPVDSWRDILLKLCELLYKENPAKMKAFVGDPSMNMKKRHYFSSISERSAGGTVINQQIPHTNIYVLTNLSANALVRFIKKILFKYGYSDSDVTIYLRADYKVLHGYNNNAED